MSNGLNIFVRAVELFQQWTGRQKQARVQKERARAKALEALLDAVNETTAYVADRREGGPRNRKREARISQLWSKAAISVHSLDKRLSTILALNSMGWADPELWETPTFRETSPGLAKIREQCLWLLNQGA